MKWMIVLVLFMFSCNGITENVNGSVELDKRESDVNQMTYVDKKHNFKIQYPKGWEKKNDLGSVIFLSPKVDSDDKFRENVSIVVVENNNQDLHQLTALSIRQLKSYSNKFELISSTESKFDSIQCVELNYTLPNLSGKYVLRCKQIIFKQNSFCYMLTFSAKEDAFDDYLVEASKLFDSFEFIE